MQPESCDSSSDCCYFSGSFRDPESPTIYQPDSFYAVPVSSLLNRTAYLQKGRKKRKPVAVKYRPRPFYRERPVNYDHPMPLPSNQLKESLPIPIPVKNSETESVPQRSSSCPHREITTIHEEVFQYKKHSSRRHLKARKYHEKAASLKVIITRVKQICVTKPEVLESSLSEDTIKMLKRIHI